ncbi:hypothetical protein Ahy_B05g077236 isoform A [Arachis hypogaea]|uniref:Dehydrogenase E1 component domain-containing protein n=1 Tax=Arachis hypogaea TaxID=3818 RepID=A0A444Z4W9_ARAHY|nr:hypothetical protein Ahy_B05g077236 isoform A [Arachis hypogaea]
MSDPGSTYRTCDEIFNERQERDPIDRVRKLLLAHDIASEKELKFEIKLSCFIEHNVNVNGCFLIASWDKILRLGNKFCGSSKSQVLRSSSIDKERANDVAEYQLCYMLIENATCCSRFLVGNGLASVNVYRF